MLIYVNNQVAVISHLPIEFKALVAMF